MEQPGPRVRERVPPRLAPEPALELRPLGRVGVAREGGEEGVGGLADVGGVQRADDEGGEGGQFSAVVAVVAVAVASSSCAEWQGDDGAEGRVVEAEPSR